MPIDMTQLGMAGASAVLGTGLGMATASWADKRQRKQTARLQEIQIKGQKELTDYNQMKALEMWKNTSYGAQKEQMKLAGINPALMYGMGGGGGQTAQVSQGNVTGGTAPVGGGEIGMGLQMGMQLQLLKAQKENIEADTKNKLQEVEGGKQDVIESKSKVNLNNAQTGNVHADTRLKNIAYELEQFDLNFKNASREDALSAIHEQARKLQGEATEALVQGNIATDTRATVEAQIAADLVGTYLRNKQIQAETNLTEQQIEEIKQAMQESVARIYNMAVGQYQKGVEISLEGMRNEIMKDFNRRFEKAAWIGAGSRVLSDIVEIGSNFIPGGKFQKGAKNIIQGFQTKKP